MEKTVRDILFEDFKFEGVSEYDQLPEWRKLAADQLLETGMTYRIIKINLDTACKKSIKYCGFVSKFISGEIDIIPLWSKPGDVQGLLMTFELLKAEITQLIKIYNADWR